MIKVSMWNHPTSLTAFKNPRGDRKAPQEEGGSGHSSTSPLRDPPLESGERRWFHGYFLVTVIYTRFLLFNDGFPWSSEGPCWAADVYCGNSIRLRGGKITVDTNGLLWEELMTGSVW